MAGAVIVAEAEDPAVVVVRPGPLFRFGYVGCGVAWLVMAVVAVFLNAPTFLLFLLPASGFVLRQAASRVEVSNSCIVVRNPLRTIRMSWDEIAQFDVTQSISSPFASVVQATTRSGSCITMQGSKNTRLEAEQVWAVLQSRIR